MESFVYIETRSCENGIRASRIWLTKEKAKNREKAKIVSHFIVRRLIITIPMVLIVITLTWGLIRPRTGKIFYTGEKKRFRPAVEKKICAKKYGLNKPWYVPVWEKKRWGKHICAEIFGTSLKYERANRSTVFPRARTLPRLCGRLECSLILLALVVWNNGGYASRL